MLFCPDFFFSGVPDEYAARNSELVAKQELVEQLAGEAHWTCRGLMPLLCAWRKWRFAGRTEMRSIVEYDLKRRSAQFWDGDNSDAALSPLEDVI